MSTVAQSAWIRDSGASKCCEQELRADRMFLRAAVRLQTSGTSDDLSARDFGGLQDSIVDTKCIKRESDGRRGGQLAGNRADGLQ